MSAKPESWPHWSRDTEFDEAMSYALRLDMQRPSKEPLPARWVSFIELAKNNGFDPPQARPGYRVHQELIALDVLFDFYHRMKLLPKREG